MSLYQERTPMPRIDKARLEYYGIRQAIMEIARSPKRAPLQQCPQPAFLNPHVFGPRDRPTRTPLASPRRPSGGLNRNPRSPAPAFHCSGYCTGAARGYGVADSKAHCQHVRTRQQDALAQPRALVRSLGQPYETRARASATGQIGGVGGCAFSTAGFVLSFVGCYGILMVE